MKVLVNRYLYKFKEMLPENVTVDFFDAEQFPNQANTYDALFLNTTTPINDTTLPDPGKISFIGTGSAGDDHINKEYLKQQNIQFANAVGCNAKSVAEFVMTALLCWSVEREKSLQDSKVGIVGVGNAGQQLTALLNTFSIPYVEYDPPRHQRESGFKSDHFDQLMDCNILTFHTPLTSTGDYPTHHLLNKSWFSDKNFDLIINTARGGIVDETVLLKELNSGALSDTIIDVWENEPAFNAKLAKRSLFATPHIAGYSIQAKLRASKMIVDAFCDHFDLPKKEMSEPEKFTPTLNGEYSSLAQILQDLHPISTYDNALKSLIETGIENRGKLFRTMRSTMQLRNEFSNTFIPDHYLKTYPELSLLGIQPK
ncbi:MAG: NAD(P)-dependent oxidoreductase [Balneolaceae bacterium]